MTSFLKTCAVGMLAIGVTTTEGPQQPAAGPVAGAPTGIAQERGAPLPDPAVIARGRQTFATNCLACHGADGRGGADAAGDLTRSAIALAADGGAQLGAFLKTGRPERRMPSFALTDSEVAELWTFVRALSPAARGGGAGRGTITAIVVGDPKAGEAYFNGAGRCATCHSATGDLKAIGTRLPVAAIQGRIVLPRGSGGYPRGFNAPPDPSEAPRTVTVTQPSGERITGTLLWITDFNVTLTDTAGVRRTVARHGDLPRVEVTDPLQYHIDHMKMLTDKDMHDLTAYLVTLK